MEGEILRNCSRSDVSGHRTTAHHVEGSVCHRTAPVDKGAYVRKYLRSTHFDKDYPKKYKAASTDNIHKLKNMLKEKEELEQMRYFLIKDLEMLRGLGSGSGGKKKMTKALTDEQFRESKVNPECETNVGTSEATKSFQSGAVIRKKSRSEMKLPAINCGGLPKRNCAYVHNITKSLSQLFGL